jgi:hypothetical protein
MDLDILKLNIQENERTKNEAIEKLFEKTE